MWWPEVLHTSVPLRFKPPTVARLRAGIMSRGQTLSMLLADLLAGKQPPQLTKLLAGMPGVKPEEALRKALDQVERRRIELDAGDDRYGRCDVCGVDLELSELGEMPWADRCAQHAAD